MFKCIIAITSEIEKKKNHVKPRTSQEVGLKKLISLYNQLPGQFQEILIDQAKVLSLYGYAYLK